MSTSSHHRDPSFASANHTSSVRSSKRPPPPPPIIVTCPPWAQDEPSSPEELHYSTNEGARTSESRISTDLVSQLSGPPDRWGIFAQKSRPSIDPNRPVESLPIPATPKSERRSLRNISLAWIPASSSLRDSSVFVRREKASGPRLTIPIEPSALYTVSHTNTPGWDTPWTSRPAAQGSRRLPEPEYFPPQELDVLEDPKDPWSRRRKKLTSFILTNVYVPLLFRFINIAFTTAALAISIRIRTTELKNNALGAVGSSPMVVIIFAPPTLVHVVMAVYLEYFGRPLGLWQTSAKLAYTLFEVFFICLWSAALSLSFDNFFTSLIPCASPAAKSWYNRLLRPLNDIASLDRTVGGRICSYQLSLICLVGVGLIAYCSNLIISLYRIFEKVKYHPGVPSSTHS